MLQSKPRHCSLCNIFTHNATGHISLGDVIMILLLSLGRAGTDIGQAFILYKVPVT